MNKIVDKIKNNIRFFENISCLTFLYAFNMLVPFFTYPYVIRVLGTELYGGIVFAQAIVMYFSLIIDFGFNISATKSISENIGDRKKVSEIVSSVLLLKFFLWVICLLFLFVSMLAFSELKNNKLLYIFAFTMTFRDLLFPQFYFQGIEKMKYITLINVFVRSLFLVSVFLIIKEQSDYLKLPLLNGIGALLGGIISLYIVFVKEKVRFSLPSKEIIKSYFKDSFVIFSTKISYHFRDRTSLILVGVIFSKAVVTYYDLAIKIIGLFVTIYQSVPSATLPRLIMTKNANFAKITFRLTIIAGVLYSILVVVFSDFITYFLGGEELLSAAPYLRLFSISTVFFSLNILLNNYLVINGYKNLMLRSTIYSISFFVLLLFILFYKADLYILITVFLFSIILETISKLYFFKKNKELYSWIY